MCFDECTPYPASEEVVRTSMELSMRWALRSKAAFADNPNALFGIVQGGTYNSLRLESAQALVDIGFDGYAIGGLSVGEEADERNATLDRVLPALPRDKPRYLMGVGKPEDLVEGVRRGVDMFDCVIPTRYARSATAFTSRGRIRLTNRRYRRDGYPIDPSCNCQACAEGFSRAYLHHLFAANEVLSAVLTTIHNLHFYQQLVREARAAIVAGRFAEHRESFLAAYTSQDSGAVVKN